MKVLLLLDVKGVGRRMDIKEVSDGYARNFLIPKKLAVPADERALQIQSVWQSKQKEILARLEESVKNLGGVQIEFSVRSGPKGEIFGSVKKDDIKAALEEKGFKESDPILDRPLKSLGEQIEILQPYNLGEISHKLYALRPDAFVVAAYAKILPKEIISIPRFGTIGVHPSLLPKYRGPTPIQTAILNGESETGVTLFLIDERVDHGPIIAHSKMQIADHNYKELEKELAEASSKLLIETLPKFLEGFAKPLPQDEKLSTYTRKFTREDGFVKPEELETAQKSGGILAPQIYRKIQALNPEPGVWTDFKGKRMKLLSAEIFEGKLKLKTVQYAGKKPVNV